MRTVGPFHGNLCPFLRSAIVADLAMRGFAISFLTLARVELSDLFLPFFRSIRQ